jgi:streptogramin lyase
MTRIKNVRVILPSVFMLVVCVGAPSIFSKAGLSTPALSGTVRTKDGKPLEGVGVSARSNVQTFTTTVYTDQKGGYFFPPLADGHYRVWAQAVGFEAAANEVDLVSGQRREVQIALPQLEDYHRQLSGTEWVSSLTEENPGDVRMKAIFISNCIGCHTASFPLQNRFDVAGWRAVIRVMSRMSTLGYVPEGAKPDEPIMAYAEELAGYLGRARGSGSTGLDLRPLPRPTGDAARVVVTEYDLSRPDMPGWLMNHNGTDWSEGTPSRYAGRAAHDVGIDKEGYVWFADDATPERTIGRLDPRTGEVKDYKLADERNLAESSHALVLDRRGNVWFANDTEGNPTEFDPLTGTFHRYPRPNTYPASGVFIAVDGEGNPWSPHKQGAFKLDPHTGEYTNYSAGSPPKANYDVAIDRENNAWIAQPGGNRMTIINSKAGKVEELALGPRQDVEITTRDRDFSSTLTLSANTATPLEKGPRRVAADGNGDFVWVCEFFADQLAKIDIHTRRVTEYPLPHRYSQPYAVTVDKNHMVWISMLSSDRIAKFDPGTGRFTEYELPTLGTEVRHIQVDNSTDPPTVWLAYGRTDKIGRVQFQGSHEAP